jgi:hypothetical protein
MTVHNLAVQLGEAGRRPEALAAAQEAVELCRELADVRPDLFGPALERANGLATALDDDMS